jgi:hypothetical protein
MQLHLQVRSLFYHNLCTVHDSFVILRLINLQFNAPPRGSQRPNLFYNNALLDIFRGVHSTSPVKGKSATLTIATGTFISKLQISTLLKNTHYYLTCTIRQKGQGSSVGIARVYGLDVLGIKSCWRQDFPHLSRPALRNTHPPVQWVPCLSRGSRAAGAWH